jgi:DNA/RNA endonuclease YhcR with UshA esterase domain
VVAMEDAKLAAACLFLALAGTLVLAASARASAPQKTEISVLGAGDVGKLVEVKGVISSVSQRESGSFFSVCSDKCVSVAVFKSLAQEMAKRSLDPALLRPGQAVSIQGVVREYSGALEIVPFDPTSIEVLGTAG